MQTPLFESVRLASILTVLMATRRVAIVVHSDAATSCIRFSFILRLILVIRMKAVSDVTVVVYLLRSLCQTHQLMFGIYAMNNTTRHVAHFTVVLR